MTLSVNELARFSHSNLVTEIADMVVARLGKCMDKLLSTRNDIEMQSC